MLTAAGLNGGGRLCPSPRDPQSVTFLVPRMNASVSSDPIKKRLAKLAIDQSKLHSQTHRVHIRKPISASTQSPSSTQMRKREIWLSR